LLHKTTHNGRRYDSDRFFFYCVDSYALFITASQEERKRGKKREEKNRFFTPLSLSCYPVEIGFATLPNQIHRQVAERGFEFNLLVTGIYGRTREGKKERKTVSLTKEGFPFPFAFFPFSAFRNIS
jgi:hypothetical protein